MSYPINHALDCWSELFLNSLVDVSSTKSKCFHGLSLLFSRVADQASLLGDSNSSHNYPLNTLASEIFL